MAQPRMLPEAAYLQECFSYDPDTGVLTWRKRPREHFPTERGWRVFNSSRAEKQAGSKTDRGYLALRLDNRFYRVHRIIIKLMTGAEPPAEVDHRHGVPDDNRWIKLRPATRTEQNWNASIRKDNTAGYRGVYPKGRKWAARITIHGVPQYLGTFNTPEEASAAYEAIARKAHGEFHRRPKLKRPTR